MLQRDTQGYSIPHSPLERGYNLYIKRLGFEHGSIYYTEHNIHLQPIVNYSLCTIQVLQAVTEEKLNRVQKSPLEYNNLEHNFEFKEDILV